MHPAMLRSTSSSTGTNCIEASNSTGGPVGCPAEDRISQLSY